MCRVSLLILLLFFSPYSVSLPTDSKEVIHIVSDSWIYNYKKGVNEYQGHVRIDQGTTHLTADKLTTKSNAYHQIKEAIAYGIRQPAHYRTVAKINEPEIHAFAKIIKYYPMESNVTFEQDVTLQNGENSFQGQLIHYNSYDQTITVPKRENSQAVIVYDPDK